MTTATAIKPVCIGPTWQRDPAGGYVMPERTLAVQIISWVEANLLGEDGEPFSLTGEQRRFLAWWYAVDARGRFLYRNGILQRLKGWGKDPLAAVIAAVEFVGPSRYGWDADTYDVAGTYPELEIGDPVAIPHPAAWIQIAAVSKDQTRNTMTLFPGIFTPEAIAEYNIDLGKEIIYAHRGRVRIEAVTSSPRALEGGRPTFVIMNETHHWLLNNEGHAMADVIDRNATKAKGGGARALSITNAYEPSEESVAQQQREAWESESSGQSVSTGTLYDSLEAPPDAKLALPQHEDGSEPTEEEVKDYIGSVIRAVRGDAVWLDIEGITSSILNRRNAPSTSRRFWYNQIVAAEDAWLDPAAVDRAVDALAEDSRRQAGSDQLRAGWLVMPDERVAMFFDGSKSDDATALVGCVLETGYVFTIGVWAKPPGEAGKTWVVPRWEVDDRVREAMTRFNVVAFWGDPSHAKDNDETRFWDGLMDEWHREYGDRLALWATKYGDNKHSVMWDMTSPERTRQFVGAAETFAEEIQAEEPPFKIDGHPALVQHFKNAKRYPTRAGVSLWKGHREGSKKIDLAVAAVGARMLRRLVLNAPVKEEKEPTGKQAGEAWGAW